MNKSDLKVGYVVKFRNGEFGLIMPVGNDIIISCNDGGWTRTKNDLISGYNQEYDVIEVYGFSKWEHLTQCLDVEKSKRKLLWKRESDPKVMTLEEIEKELGYKIKLKEETTFNKPKWNSPFNPPSGMRNVIVKMEEEEICYTGYYSCDEIWHVWINKNYVEFEKDNFNSIYGWIDEPNEMDGRIK